MWFVILTAVMRMKGLLGIGHVNNWQHIQSHSHTVWEMVYYTEGRPLLTLDGVGYNLSPGTFVCQPPFVSHGEDGFDTFGNYWFSVFDFDVLPNQLIIVSDTVDSAVLGLIRQMHFVFLHKPPNYSLLCDALLNTISQYVLSQLGTNTPSNPFVQKFVLELMYHASDCQYKISDGLKKVPFSYDYFRLLFKKEMGCTPIEYLNHTRISNAKNLLSSRNSGLSVASIAALCGFSDPLYFSRLFKKETGVSPSGWTG